MIQHIFINLLSEGDGSMNRIMVSSKIKLCLANKEGMILRGLIESNFITNEKVILDFSGLSTYASPFFNISLGYYIGKYGKEKYEEIVEIQNLSPVGQRVYNTVFDNAIKYHEANNKSEIDTIVQNTDK